MTKNKLFSALLLALGFLMCLGQPLLAADDLTIYLKGRLLVTDPPPVIVSGITMIPVRTFAEALDAALFWDSTNQTITVIKKSTKVRLTVGEKMAYLGDQVYQLATPPMLWGEAAYVPLRFISRALGTEVQWDELTRTVFIRDGNSLTYDSKTPRQIFDDNKEAIFKIEALDQEGNPFKSGSGFCVSRDGKFLTNYHVISQARSVRVIFNDNTSMLVREVLGYDKGKDIALLKLSSSRLPRPVEFGSSGNISIGDRVVAIGSPLGYTNSITSGLLSGMRNIYDNQYLQMSTPISPGNSGGPLFDSNGKVIGIITAQVMGGDSINLAIPIDAAKSLLNVTAGAKTLEEASLRETGKGMTLAEFSDHLNAGFSWISFQNWKVQATDMDVSFLDDNVIGVIIPIGGNSYPDWLVIKSQDSTKLSSWLKNIKGEVNKYYPGYNFLGMIIFVKPMENVPLYHVTVPLLTLTDVTGAEQVAFN